MKTIECEELTEVVWVDPERMGGMACFKGTRVPIETLFHYLEAGEPLSDFLEGFPTVTKEQALAILSWSKWQACKEVGALETFAR